MTEITYNIYVTCSCGLTLNTDDIDTARDWADYHEHLGA